ncbi:MAG: hypothetical protein IH946_05215 [Bacteroidetes bacterium]|nr:hypothetical protein [Bacteroidota bacterium]
MVRSFSISLTILILINAIIIFALSVTTELDALVQFSWLGLGFFFFLTIVVFLMYKAGTARKQQAGFTIYVYGAMGLKFFLSIICLLTYLYFIRPETKLIVIPFFLQYVAFTFLETYYIAKSLRQH